MVSARVRVLTPSPPHSGHGSSTIRPRAAAVGARLGERERALVAADQAAARAGGALPRGRARPCAAAGARLAAAGGREPDRHLGTLHRLREVDPQLALDVRTALPAGRRRPRATAAGPTEDAAEQVAQPGTGTAGVAEQVAHVEGLPAPAGETAPREAAGTARETAPEGTAAGEHLPRLVVLPALLLVREHPVGLGHRLEAGLGLRVARVGVGVQLAGELAVRLLDLVLGRAGGDAQLTVEVLLDPVPLSHDTSSLALGGIATRAAVSMVPSQARSRCLPPDQAWSAAGSTTTGASVVVPSSARSTTTTIAGRSTRSPMR